MRPEIREIAWATGYGVSRDGSVWSCRPVNGIGPLKDSWHQLAPVTRKRKTRHQCVTLRIDGRSVIASIHRLILEAFCGPCPEGMEGCHNNGDPTDNQLSNLRWDTRESNHADKNAHGTDSRGSKHPMSRLTEDDVRNIRRSVEGSSRGTGSALARVYGVTPAAISAIKNRKLWRHVR